MMHRVCVPCVCCVAALQSVFPQTELATFQTLHKRDKERQLLELSMLVTGIRLFNKDAGKGGEGIDDRVLLLLLCSLLHSLFCSFVLFCFVLLSCS